MKRLLFALVILCASASAQTVVQKDACWYWTTHTGTGRCATTVLSLAYPSPNTLHNMLVVVTGAYDGISSISDTAGNSWAEVPGTGIYGGFRIFYVCDAKAGANTVTLGNAGDGEMAIYEFSGNPTTGCFDAYGAEHTNNSTVSTTTSVTSSTEWVLTAAWWINATPLTAGTGYTLQTETISPIPTQLMVELKNVTTGLSGTQSGSVSATVHAVRIATFVIAPPPASTRKRVWVIQ